MGSRLYSEIIVDGICGWFLGADFVAERAEIVENWLKPDGAVVPAPGAVEAKDSEVRLDATSFFGSAPSRRVWRPGLLGAVRMAMPTAHDSGQ